MVDKYYKNVNSWNNHWILRLKAIYLKEILFNLVPKELQQYKVNILVFIHFDFIFSLLVCGFFNIQYQRTGISPLSSFNEIELRQSIRGLFPSIYVYGTFLWKFSNIIFFQNLIIKLEQFTRRKINRANCNGGPIPMYYRWDAHQYSVHI